VSDFSGVDVIFTLDVVSHFMDVVGCFVVEICAVLSGCCVEVFGSSGNFTVVGFGVVARQYEIETRNTTKATTACNLILLACFLPQNMLVKSPRKAFIKFDENNERLLRITDVVASFKLPNHIRQNHILRHVRKVPGAPTLISLKTG
jgi:hypothetical protein